MALEINLVPDIKNEMIKALKLRNLIFFICIVVASASVVVSIIFAVIAGGQQAVVDGKKGTIDLLSSKIESYGELSDFLTIKDQLSNISAISDRKQLLSRIFGVLSALLPSGPDTITISELNVNFEEEEPTISFDAQANAGSDPFIDYNVLDSFKKSMQYMRYDYGNYIDRYGKTIPAYCMIETGSDGATFYDQQKGYYAFWLINGEGCNPSAIEEVVEEEVEEVEENSEGAEGPDTEGPTESESESPVVENIVAGYPVENYNGETVVRIWRTPQYNEWYQTGNMSLDGSISDIPHFDSSCITYSGTEAENGEIHWASTNNSCLLVPDGTDGIAISDSSNGRGNSSELVLRFSATITLNSEVFSFNNKHLIAIAPSGRYNVTDSYVQIQNMFAERASDCADGDTACESTINTGGQ
ncbi:MAG: hypothetical protein Q4B29_00270 [Candidatus Saccharibacteria bacterium]|nr:hypothetical protein [Candidatus Saccharibacteria bacterium]